MRKPGRQPWARASFQQRVDRPALIVGVDINGVLTDANTPLLAILNQRFRRSYTAAEITTYDGIAALYRDCHPVIKRVIGEIINDPEFILDLVPDPGALAALSLLDAAGARIIITTGHAPQREDVVRATLRWVQRNRLPFERVVHSRYKDDLCRQLNLTYLIEDSPRHVEPVLATKTHLLLVDRPYNQTAGPDPQFYETARFTRVRDLAHAVEIILGLQPGVV